MDTHNDTTMALYELRAETAGQKLVAGAKQLRKALTSGNARRVYLARNADPAITEFMENLCRAQGVSYAWVKSMKDLGEAAGIEVGAAVITAVNN